MSKFKVGDMVRTSIELAKKHGDLFGIGAEFWEDSKTRKVLAVFDDNPEQTDYKLSGTCFFWPEYALVSAESREFIVIRRDKSDVIASHKRGDEIVKTAKATCAPSDEFNFETGAKLAFDRLMGREEPQLIAIGDTHYGAQKPAPKFKVGDRVKTEYGVGTIVEIQHDDMPFLVLHDTWNEGHNAKFFAPHLRLTGERSEWFEERDITLIPNEFPAPEPKYYTGKVVMLDAEGCPFCKTLYLGKIFEFKDGICTDEAFVGKRLFKSFDDFKGTMHSESWVEVKE